MANLLELQPLLINRINAALPTTFKFVGSPIRLAGTRDLTALLPGCFIAPGAGSVGAPSVAPVQAEEQKWDVILMVPNIAGTDEAFATEVLAGDLMLKVINLLSGWEPQTKHRKMSYLGRDAATYAQGYAEFALHFSVTVGVGS